MVAISIILPLLTLQRKIIYYYSFACWQWFMACSDLKIFSDTWCLRAPVSRSCFERWHLIRKVIVGRPMFCMRANKPACTSCFTSCFQSSGSSKAWDACYNEKMLAELKRPCGFCQEEFGQVRPKNFVRRLSALGTNTQKPDSSGENLSWANTGLCVGKGFSILAKPSMAFQ